jgi:phage gp36-like protein
MAYCTEEDVRSLIPLIDESAMDSIALGKLITKAENLVNGKLKNTYVVPFDPVPPLVKDITAEYTAYLAYRTVFSQNSPNSSEFVTGLKESAEALISELAEGKLMLEADMLESFSSTSEFEQKIFTLKDITPFRI